MTRRQSRSCLLITEQVPETLPPRVVRALSPVSIKAGASVSVNVAAVNVRALGRRHTEGLIIYRALPAPTALAYSFNVVCLTTRCALGLRIQGLHE